MKFSHRNALGGKVRMGFEIRSAGQTVIGPAVIWDDPNGRPATDTIEWQKKIRLGAAHRRLRRAVRLVADRPVQRRRRDRQSEHGNVQRPGHAFSRVDFVGERVGDDCGQIAGVARLAGLTDIRQFHTVH